MPLPALEGLGSLLEVVREFWRDRLRQPDPGDLKAALSSALSVPFVDYARGDGLAIGTGQEQGWSPVLIDDSTDWVDGYRGLFGLDTHDRFAGERAPAGPKYTRAGTVRQSWNDPLGFAGLEKVAPPHRQPGLIGERINELEEEAETISAQFMRLAKELPRLELEVRSLARSGSTSALHAKRAAELEAGETELAGLQDRSAGIDDAIASMRRELRLCEAGQLGDPQGHLRHPHRPVPPEENRYNVVVEFWSAASVGVLLILIAGLVFFRLTPWWGALLVAVGGYIVIELALRRRLTTLLLRAVLVLAVVGALILAVDFSLELVLLAVVGLALLVVSDNVREISGR